MGGTKFVVVKAKELVKTAVRFSIIAAIRCYRIACALLCKAVIEIGRNGSRKRALQMERPGKID